MYWILYERFCYADLPDHAGLHMYCIIYEAFCYVDLPVHLHMYGILYEAVFYVDLMCGILYEATWFEGTPLCLYHVIIMVTTTEGSRI